MKLFTFFRTILLSFSVAAIGPLAWAEEPAASAPETQAAPAAQEPSGSAVLTPEVSPQTSSALAPEKSDAIRQTAEKLIREEIDTIGSFEVDHPETGDLLNLSLERVGQEVKQSDEGEYLLRASFKDPAGAAYGVDIYVEEISEGEYELADAIIVEIDGKPVTGV